MTKKITESQKKDAEKLGDTEAMYAVIEDRKASTCSNPFWKTDVRWQIWQNAFESGMKKYSEMKK